MKNRKSVLEGKEKNKKKGRRTALYVFLCIGVFLISFCGSAAFKLTRKPSALQKYTVEWNEKVGTVYTDFSYGEDAANKFDLYLPADNGKETYGLVVYLHAGGFTSGDKSDDAAMLEWLCSLGYVAAGINYTLCTEETPDANVYTQSMDIKNAVPAVVEQAKALGYNVDRLCMSGGSAGGCLALIYAYRDADEAPVPVKMVFEAVGPSSFYPEDWKCYGFDKSSDAAAAMFTVLSGKTVTPEMFGTAEYEELMKEISALYWVDGNTVPTVMAYGALDKIQPYESSVRLEAALTENGVPHKYIVCEHSGHGLQNDDKEYADYMEAVLEYLEMYMSE